MQFLGSFWIICQTTKLCNLTMRLTARENNPRMWGEDRASPAVEPSSRGALGALAEAVGNRRRAGWEVGISLYGQQALQ